jgi:hypothetical protein
MFTSKKSGILAMIWMSEATLILEQYSLTRSTTKKFVPMDCSFWECVELGLSSFPQPSSNSNLYQLECSKTCSIHEVKSDAAVTRPTQVGKHPLCYVHGSAASTLAYTQVVIKLIVGERQPKCEEVGTEAEERAGSLRKLVAASL